MKLITSKDNPRIKELCKLKDAPRDESFLVEGFHLVEMAYQEGCLDEVYALKDPHFEGVEFIQVSEAVLNKLTNTKSPEGIVGLAHTKANKNPNPKRILLLDKVQDPGNVGTLLRSGLAFGIETFIFTFGAAKKLNDKVIMASQGAIFTSDIRYMSEEDALTFISTSGLPFIATALQGATPLEETKLPKEYILGLGNEGKGMSQALLEQSTYKVKIPMAKMESLNVASAGAILLYLLFMEAKS